MTTRRQFLKGTAVVLPAMSFVAPAIPPTGQPAAAVAAVASEHPFMWYFSCASLLRQCRQRYRPRRLTGLTALPTTSGRQ